MTPPFHARTVKAPRTTGCVYCGSRFDNKDVIRSKDHVPPNELYPPNSRKPQLQLLTVPSCTACNNATSQNEAKFRALMLLAGDQPNTARRDNFPTLLRSFDQKDGRAQWQFVMKNLREVIVEGQVRHKVYPAESTEVFAVVRKIVRGLCYHHDVQWPVADAEVNADVLRYRIPQDFEEYLDHDVEWFHVEREILEYKFGLISTKPTRSWWMLTFYESCTFIAWVGDFDEPTESGVPRHLDVR